MWNDEQVDVGYIHELSLQSTPDVLICPSRLAPMAKDVLGTVFVNPGTLAKGLSGGTYAEVTVHPMNEEDLRDLHLKGSTDPIPHNVASRCCVQIVRI